MAKGSGKWNRIGIILTTSLGPLLLMFDLFAVVVSEGRIVWGPGGFGEAFPSAIGMIGIGTWAVGIGLAVARKINRSATRSMRARPVFLKGRKGIRCYNCGKWLDTSDAGYRKLMTCDCGANYEMFQEGPWDQ